jgi:hypothetical protein
MRFKATLDLLLQLLVADLEGIDLRTSERQQEAGPVQPRDLGGLALRDEALAIPLDGGGDPELSG